jgi:SAM-dependent methyltransferase
MSEADREKWDARYRERGPESRVPSPFLTSLADTLPRRGRALDVAGGAGRHALWLAAHGLDVTLVDISQAGLEIARADAAAAGQTLTLVRADLERDPLPPGPFDVVVSCYFLRRELFPAFPGVLAPGGLLVFVQPTMANLQRHARPPAPFLLEDGELPRLLRGLEIIRYDEGWFGEAGEKPGQDPHEARHEARLLARRGS